MLTTDKTHSWLDRQPIWLVLNLSLAGVLCIGAIDYLSGYEISISLFYLGPVALAAWHIGRKAGLAIALASCISWYIADQATGRSYSNQLIPVWNALVRFGFFAITGTLLATLRASYHQQRHLASTDTLTGLLVRRAFQDRLTHDLAMARRQGTPLSLCYIDIDDFKAVNDRFGHAVGDQLLLTFGNVLKESVRETDTVARLGGDEFVTILPDTDSRGVQVAIANIREQLNTALQEKGFKASCSIGVVTFSDPRIATPELALSAADKLMYQVKRSGKGSVNFQVLGGEST